MSPSRAPAAAPPLGLVVALEVERHAVERLLRPWTPEAGPLPIRSGMLGGRSVVLIQAGLGADRSGEAVRLIARRFGCRSVWSVGLAAGLDQSLRPGDLVFPDLVIGPDGRRLDCPIPPALRAVLDDLPVHTGPLVSVASPALTPAAKQALRAASGAAALDMEASGVASAADRLGLSWLVLKAVLDPAELPVPPYLLVGAGPDGATRPCAFLWQACRPARLRTAARFLRLSRHALQRLAHAAERVAAAGLRLDGSPPVQ